jgi:hypothetical protein
MWAVLQDGGDGVSIAVRRRGGKAVRADKFRSLAYGVRRRGESCGSQTTDEDLMVDYRTRLAEMHRSPDWDLGDVVVSFVADDLRFGQRCRPG